MSANLIVDLSSTTQSVPSLPGAVVLSPSGMLAGLSGQLVGVIVDMLHADTFTNVYIAGRSYTSGPLLVGVQTSPNTTSGNFTDPTSGLAQLPTWFSSGGWLQLCRSGTAPGTKNNGEGVSGQFALSGFVEFAAFQRPHRYARLVFGSGFYDGRIEAGFVGQYHNTGSGAGFSLAPGSGSVSV